MWKITRKKAFIQFSKRIITAVTAAVTILCAAAIVLCWLGGSMDNVVAVVQAYIGYATVAFVAYSGNSAMEKWILNRCQPPTTAQTAADATSDVG